MYTAAVVIWGVLKRYAPEFSVLFAATLALNGQEWYQDRFGTAGRVGTGWSLWSVGGRAVTILVIFLCVAKVLLGGLPVPGFAAVEGDGQFGFGYDRDDFAFEAADFLKTAPVPGQRPEHDQGRGRRPDLAAYPLQGLHRQPPAPVPARALQPPPGDPQGPEHRRREGLETQFLVRQFGRVLARRHLELSAARVDRVAGNGDRMREAAVHGIEAQQMRIGLDRPQIVDRYHLDVGAAGFDDGPEDIAADAAKAIDCDANGHGMLLEAGNEARKLACENAPASYNCALTASTTALAVMPKYS